MLSCSLAAIACSSDDVSASSEEDEEEDEEDEEEEEGSILDGVKATKKPGNRANLG